MTDFLNAPIENNFKTTLVQVLGSAATDLILYCAKVPTGTITGGRKVRVTINPRRGFTYQEDVMVTSIDTVNKTMTIASSADRALARYNGDAGSRKVHNPQSEVYITDPYGLWAEIQTACNSKMDKSGGTFTGSVDFSGASSALRVPNLTTAQRTALTAANGMIVYDTDLGVHYQYIGGAWSTFATGSVLNATNAAAGKVELSTQAEMDAGTQFGTSATIVPSPDQIQLTILKGITTYSVMGGGTTAYTATLVPALNSYTTGQRFWLKVNVTNTGASTLTVNGTATRTIKKNTDQDVVEGDMPAGALMEIMYDGTNMVILAISSPYAFMTTKGDLIVASAANTPIRKAVGANDTVLVADSTAAGGIKWGAVPITTSNAKSNVTSRAGNAASGNQVIAHGLGKIPALVEISTTWYASGASAKGLTTNGNYDGTTTNSITNFGFSTGTAGNSNTYIIYVEDPTTGGVQKATITIDATNITLAWTKTGTPPADAINILWKVIG